ncbi:DUF4278 domain-containing protein [Acaryochloris sp. IP29b_bin.137]|uniref:DUF4278 domain-containing protein n=1 Tax=Acaryochloris sp. IP29b_bin.137 TaxID=2969217 RepID=UPI00261CFD56|nr:DUF4278 domain-containing protein [Acaryochloris sp. IP29b_bin.137]
MKLTYRGVEYDYTPPQVDMTASGEVGQYRGLEWRFRNPQTVPVLQPNLDLVYRGVPYQTGQPEAVSTPVYTPAPTVAPTEVEGLSVANMARALMMSHHKWIKTRQQALLTRVATEVGLGADAAYYWNHIQGKVHPSFRSSYDRSRAALS